MRLGARILQALLRFISAILNIPIRLKFVILTLVLACGGVYWYTHRTMLDAVGGAIRHIVRVHKHLPEDERPEKTMFIITTDGMENASHCYTADEVKRMIQHEKEKYGWEFIFLAANIDAVESAADYGIDAEMAVNYVPDDGGTQMAYATMNMAIGQARNGVHLKEKRVWREAADKDFKKRGR